MTSDPYLTKLFAEIHGDPGELEMVGVIHRRVTVVWKDGCNLRSVPVVGTKILKVLKPGTFYETTKDERVFLMPRSEFIIQHERVLEDIRQLRESKAMLEGKASQSSVMISLAIAVIGVGISLVALLLH